MRFYDRQHQYYGGVDLHARTMYLHVLDQQGKTRFEGNLAADPGVFLDSVARPRQLWIGPRARDRNLDPAAGRIHRGCPHAEPTTN